MTNIVSIAIDAMGGDNSPEKTIKGIKLFLDNNKNNKDFFLTIFGKEQEIKKNFEKFDIKSDFV